MHKNEILQDIEKSRCIGVTGIVVGVGALAVAVVNACRADWDASTICALSGVFSTVMGALNLKYARDARARLEEYRKKHLGESRYRTWIY